MHGSAASTKHAALLSFIPYRLRHRGNWELDRVSMPRNFGKHKLPAANHCSALLASDWLNCFSCYNNW